jgi:DNA topoisomerase-1
VTATQPTIVLAKGGKYKRRWRGSDGKWRYEYPEDRKGRPRAARAAEEPVRRGAPGSQLPADVRERLTALGVKKLPAAAIPLSDIEVKLTPERGIHQRAVLTWRDGRGERQNAYTQRFHEASAQKKWERVLSFRDEVPRFIRRGGRQLGTAEHGTISHQGLTIALIIAQTGLRPGSERSLQKTGHRGISTLTSGNVKIAGDVVTFEYTGKAGKENTGSVRSRALAQALRKYKRGKKRGDRLFDTTALAAAREHLPEGMLLKDFRTVRATNEAIKALDAVVSPPPLSGNPAKDRRALRKALRQASAQVADVLNNTPAVAMASYIHPVIFDQWVRDKVGADPASWK